MSSFLPFAAESLFPRALSGKQAVLRDCLDDAHLCIVFAGARVPAGQRSLTVSVKEDVLKLLGRDQVTRALVSDIIVLVRDVRDRAEAANAAKACAYFGEALGLLQAALKLL